MSTTRQRLRVATRESALALWQAEHVQQQLEAAHPGLAVELVPMTTRGDRIIDRPLSAIGGKGLFLKELETALLDGRADIAVHSLKDVPAELPEGLALPVFLERANPADALVCASAASLADLPAGARIGTSSLRRQCQLRAAYPALEVKDLRGNVNTRLQHLDDGRYDAILLACAGLERLGMRERIAAELQPPAWLPAPGQGIIAIECRIDDAATRELIATLNHTPTETLAVAERALGHTLEASCEWPLGAYAVLDGDYLHLSGLLGDPASARLVRAEVQGPASDAEALGQQCARKLLAAGGAEILKGL